MEIQPIVIGTAGHIDHGKSTLVRALTGIDPDRLEEEKARGMTIDLGFANFALPDGRRVGIVDVPGHERFIKNMVAGASGIDVVMLVVAADDAVMPQTREHLAIMELLGVERGLVALTKIDLVEPEMVELAEEDVREAVRGTFLEDAPLVRVSGVTGQGLDELRNELSTLAEATPPRDEGGVFRMPVQRVFSVRGFGTVVTGIPLSGQARPGDVLEVLPGGKRGRVRGLQAYHEAAEQVRAGHSAALNLSDVAREDVRRGHVVATPGYFRPTPMLACRLRLLADLPRPLRNRAPVRLHVGTAEAVGEVVLLDAPELEPGAEGLVQVRLSEPVVAAPGDRYVLRLASPLVTLGGGVVLEESRHRLKRFKAFVIEELAQQAESLDSPRDLLESVLHRRGLEPAPLDELAAELHRPREEVEALLAELEQRGVAVAVPGARGWLHADLREEALARLRAALEAWFAEHPLRAVVERRDLRGKLPIDDRLFDALLAWEEERGGLERLPGGRLRIAGREPELADADRELLERITARLAAAGLQPPTAQEIAAAVGAPEGRVAELLRLAADRGEVVHVGKGLYLAASEAERVRGAIVANCERHGHLEIPELRDELGTTRKYLIPILEHFDAVGLTIRQGGHRILRRRS